MMHNRCWHDWRATAAALMLALGLATAAQAEPPAPMLANAVSFIRSRQGADGAFGNQVQPRLQTSLAMLALLATVPVPPGDEDLRRLARGADYLEKNAANGCLGDPVYTTESHAVATLALLCTLEVLREPAQREPAAQALTRAVQWLERNQDRGASPQTQGGWKQMQGEQKANDRRATAWALMALYAARGSGLPVKESGLKRGVQFLLAAAKPADASVEQAGGFSVDADGLAVESMSAMGGWGLARSEPGSARQTLNRQWLVRHPPLWAGPNYFYANFFRTRALRFGDAAGTEFSRTQQRLAAQLRDQQVADGSFSCPPGEAQNSADMGPVFSTSLAVLILTAGSSPLPCDADHRVQPLFAAPEGPSRPR